MAKSGMCKSIYIYIIYLLTFELPFPLPELLELVIEVPEPLLDPLEPYVLSRRNSSRR